MLTSSNKGFEYVFTMLSLSVLYEIGFSAVPTLQSDRLYTTNVKARLHSVL